MAFQMIHMEIAYRLLEQLPQIEHAAEFVLGSVAPDSVHMAEEYDINRKVGSHLFEGCGPWSETEDYERWMENIRGWFLKLPGVFSEADAYRDFMLGMCVHCLTDYWNDVRVWRRLRAEYIPPMKLEEFRAAYYPEAKGIDQWLHQNNKNTEKIRELLLQAQSFSVDGMIKKEELDKQREHLLKVQYAVEPVDISQYRFLSEDFLEEFICFAVEDIAGKMKNWSE